LGYRLYWHRPLLFNQDNYFKQEENLWPHTMSINMLGIHKSFIQDIRAIEILDPEERLGNSL
jgi:hypothetical protein